MVPCIVNVFCQAYRQDATLYIFFITVNAVHVSGGFSAHHQELKNCTYSIWYMSSLLAATASVGSWDKSPTLASKLDIYPMLCVQFLRS
jgi:hypothetical protein